MRCTVCGAQAAPDAAVCPVCGASLQPAVPAQPTGAKGGRFGVAGVGAFLGLTILYAIPVIGWICCLVMACGAVKNQNLRNFARANLILILIAAVLCVGGYFVFTRVVRPIVTRAAVQSQLGTDAQTAQAITEVLGKQSIGDLVRQYREGTLDVDALKADLEEAGVSHEQVEELFGQYLQGGAVSPAP